MRSWLRSGSIRSSPFVPAAMPKTWDCVAMTRSTWLPRSNSVTRKSSSSPGIGISLGRLSALGWVSLVLGVPPSGKGIPQPRQALLGTRARALFLRGRSGGEGSVHEAALFVSGFVVGVDEGGPVVAVTHPLLQDSHWHAGGGDPGAERMTQVVKADHAHPRGFQRLLEAAYQRAVVKHFATQRVGEDEIVLAAEARAPRGGLSARLRLSPKGEQRVRRCATSALTSSRGRSCGVPESVSLPSQRHASAARAARLGAFRSWPRSGRSPCR